MWFNLTDNDLAILKTAALVEGAVGVIVARIEEQRAEQLSDNATAIRALAPEFPDDDVEFDGDAVVSFGGNPGAYVMAWVWVRQPDAEDKEDEED